MRLMAALFLLWLAFVAALYVRKSVVGFSKAVPYDEDDDQDDQVCTDGIRVWYSEKWSSSQKLCTLVSGTL